MYCNNSKNKNKKTEIRKDNNQNILIYYNRIVCFWVKKQTKFKKGYLKIKNKIDL